MMVAVPCKSCQAPMLWVRNITTGKLIPLDAEPVENGNIGILPEKGMAKYLSAADREAARAAGMKLYVSHFATCPSAARYRRA